MTRRSSKARMGEMAKTQKEGDHLLLLERRSSLLSKSEGRT